jgi:hypothetical protein
MIARSPPPWSYDVPSQPGLTTLLTELAASGVEFILVGGLAAVAQGAPVTTFDVDIVHARTADNVDRLLDFLTRIHARYRGRPGGQPLGPSRAALEGPGHSLFMTDLGPLDVLGTIENGLDYDDLLAEHIELEVQGYAIRVLALATIVRHKRASPHAKDQRVLPILEEALRQSEGGDSEPT